MVFRFLFETFPRVPKWIRRLDDTLPDKQLLLQLIRVSPSHIESPREISFIINGLKTRTDAENAVHYLKEKGWQCRTKADYKDRKQFLVEASKLDYVITEHNFLADVAEFNRVAALYDASYDGWCAEVL